MFQIVAISLLILILIGILNRKLASSLIMGVWTLLWVSVAMVVLWLVYEQWPEKIADFAIVVAGIAMIAGPTILGGYLLEELPPPSNLAGAIGRYGAAYLCLIPYCWFGISLTLSLVHALVWWAMGWPLDTEADFAIIGPWAFALAVPLMSVFAVRKVVQWHRAALATDRSVK